MGCSVEVVQYVVWAAVVEVSPGCPESVTVLGRWLYPEGAPAGQPRVKVRRDRNTIEKCILEL